MKEWNIGDIVSKEDYTACAISLNKKGTMHIEKKDGQYVVVANEIYVPTKQEILMQKEQETGLIRAIREMILSDNSGVSDYVKNKAVELETLAKEIREESEK